jgi:predicted RNase H-like HicB family nuclease
MRDTRYAVVVEEDIKGFGAYVPDLLSCVAVGETKEKIMPLIQEAIGFHITDCAKTAAYSRAFFGH